MNTLDKENPNPRERLPRTEVEAASPERDRSPEGTVQEYKGKTIEAVNAQTESAITSGSEMLKSAQAIGNSTERTALIRQEQGVDTKIGGIRHQIENLGKYIKSKIERVGTEATVEQRERKERTKEKFQEQRGNILTKILTHEITSNSLDLIPFGGGVKMMVEAIAKKTLSGKKLDGRSRIIHAAMGAGSLALDFTGVGEMEKGVVVVGKGASLIEKIGAKLSEKGVGKMAKVFAATSRFMRAHPELTTEAEKLAQLKINDQIKNIKNYREQTA